MEDKNYDFSHLCYTEKWLSGSPIINLKNNKVIGIHKEATINNYNKGLFLNYPIKEFINKYKNNNIIKELNEIFQFNKENQLTLEDFNNLELNLRLKDLGNKGIENLYNFDIPNLKELNLSSNQISDIKVLEKVKFKNLKELDLSWNQISDIKVLEKVKFENLEKLGLSDNQIDENEYSVLIQNLNERLIEFDI